MAFMFVGAKEAFLKGTLNLKTTVFSITPVEATPSPAMTLYSEVSGKSTTGGGTSLVRTLLDIGSDNNNRFVDDPGNNRIKMGFQLVEYPALSTDTSAPILGFVIAVGANPTGSALPVFYIECVNGVGTVAPFVPDGVEDLNIDTVKYPITAAYRLGTFDDYLDAWIRGTKNPYSKSIGIVLLESEPATSLTTYLDIQSIAAKTPANQPVYLDLAEFGDNITNRVLLDSTYAYYRFANPRFSTLETLSGNPVTHYALIEKAGGSVANSDALICYAEFSPAFTPNGVKDWRILLGTGSALRI